MHKVAHGTGHARWVRSDGVGARTRSVSAARGFVGLLADLVRAASRMRLRRSQRREYTKRKYTQARLTDSLAQQKDA